MNKEKFLNAFKKKVIVPIQLSEKGSEIIFNEK